MTLLTLHNRPIKVMETDDKGVVYYRDLTNEEIEHVAKGFLAAAQEGGLNGDSR